MSEFLKDGDKPLQLQISVLIFTGLLRSIHLFQYDMAEPQYKIPDSKLKTLASREFFQKCSKLRSCIQRPTNRPFTGLSTWVEVVAWATSGAA
jgi:hypothetical protein